jgi:hypothetical protein
MECYVGLDVHSKASVFVIQDAAPAGVGGPQVASVSVRDPPVTSPFARLSQLRPTSSDVAKCVSVVSSIREIEAFKRPIRPSRLLLAPAVP